MLSILVPVYNFEVVDFVKELKLQAEKSNIDFEILCYDDCSESYYKQRNRGLSNLAGVYYKELPENYGRSRIRNKLAQDARYEQLLFVDCDSSVVDSQYITKYLAHASSEKIIYGGRAYPEIPPKADDFQLWWHYGIQKDIANLTCRQKQPYLYFKTNNFLVPKRIFESYKLNEKLVGYGHEDTLFGLKLKEEGVPITHIDNPLCHIGEVSNQEFITKTNEGLANMAYLIQKGLMDKEIKLYNCYTLLERFRLKKLFLTFFRNTRKQLLNNLLSRNPRLAFLDFYKIGMLLENLEATRAKTSPKEPQLNEEGASMYS